MKCPLCQHDNPQGARFCEECATPLARTCSNCGTALSAWPGFATLALIPLTQRLSVQNPAPATMNDEGVGAATVRAR
jgi:hypothetical protein